MSTRHQIARDNQHIKPSLDVFQLQINVNCICECVSEGCFKPQAAILSGPGSPAADSKDNDPSQYDTQPAKSHSIRSQASFVCCYDKQLSIGYVGPSLASPQGLLYQSMQKT